MSIVSRILNRDEDDQPSVDVQAVFDALRNERRRNTLRIIQDLDDGTGVRMGEVADMLATLESDGPGFETVDRKRAYVSLYQTHVPHLEGDGFLQVTDLEGANTGRLHTTEAAGVALTILDDIHDRLEEGQ